MTTIELTNKITQLENTLIAMQTEVNNLHLSYATKLQWKDLDRLREQEINDLKEQIGLLEKQIVALESAIP
jgi:cob(I)alamin adenosyltransferase